MEECILSSDFSFTCKLLNIVNDKHIDTLVEIDEVIDKISTNSIDILHLEDVACDIQNSLFRQQLKYLKTDSLCQMRLAHTACTEDEERVESVVSRMLRHGDRCTEGQFVALSFKVCCKSAILVQVSIKFGFSDLCLY